MGATDDGAPPAALDHQSFARRARWLTPYQAPAPGREDHAHAIKLTVLQNRGTLLIPPKIATRLANSAHDVNLGGGGDRNAGQHEERDSRWRAFTWPLSGWRTRLIAGERLPGDIDESFMMSC